MISRRSRPSSSASFLLHLFFFVVSFCCSKSNAQNATTDPAEARALNSIFQQWGTQAVDSWNISGEPCSGSALSQSDSVFEDPTNNPAIRCDCSFNSNTLCHITRLRVYALDRTGVIPEELLGLPFLTFLKIDQNFFTGSLPAFIGNMSRLESLSFGENRFSGTLPPELGNLVNLEQLWASDNAFTGKIPDFVGNNWTQLTSLRFEGNSFEGPIPSSFANLNSLTSLVLRNVLLTGTLPSYITELQSLQKLDLSFNNLTGQIPSALFNMDSLTYLFLGNNSLSGPIPSRKSETLQTIDISYNMLSGNLPSWINSDLNLNFVANNFELNSSSSRLLPGLECLQRSFACNRNSPRYANFSIKCGGPRMMSNGIVFEAENQTLGAAGFNVTSAQNWAVSNVGLFADRQNQLYVQNTLAQVTRTTTPELYQTSRLSPGSLRYYGLGLKNGLYTVNLFFAETAFSDQSTRSWRSLGRRIFDVYIQGTRQLRDFEISKEAGGVERAIVKNFTANVTDNHLEIHLFWAGKGTCCTPEQGYYGPSISAINVVPNFIPTVSGIPPGTHEGKNQTGFIVGITVPIVFVALILVFVIIYIKRRKKDDDEEVFIGIGPRPNTFSYAELKTATEDFSPSKKLGEGGFGPVFKGTLSDGRVVAVKQLSVASHHGRDQFITEIATISAVQHRNLVQLYGCCIEGNRRLLVYEYLENKSLDQTLFGHSGLHLDWPTRFNICLSVARGLAYLHEESRPRIVHRDVKASNILLDAEMCPKISDFGLAKLYDDKKTHISTRVAGTIGYLAPEYAMRGHLTEKADVFGFGVVALEILCGRPNTDTTLQIDRIYLLEWAWNLYENDQSLNLVDPTLAEFNKTEAFRVLGVALLCTQASPSMRPLMSRVVAMLAGDIEVSTVTSKPSYLTDYDFKDITGTFMSEETQTSMASSTSDNTMKSNNNAVTVTDPGPSPVNVSGFGDILAEGR
ncbi:hypothetical protein ES319_A09G080000v1 [Gossypium barbadense]|uniref:non-specific serine/threonine protein kinase n=2 Tax=Gossypium barbadense TaxID=3634 RepID=A0A5J5UBC0_GOSBA|nr:hypothetical protein ES319_A09G080000v1 [Gossypium barbadense]